MTREYRILKADQHSLDGTVREVFKIQSNEHGPWEDLEIRYADFSVGNFFYSADDARKEVERFKRSLIKPVWTVVE